MSEITRLNRARLDIVNGLY